MSASSVVQYEPGLTTFENGMPSNYDIFQGLAVS